MSSSPLASLVAFSSDSISTETVVPEVSLVALHQGPQIYLPFGSFFFCCMRFLSFSFPGVDSPVFSAIVLFKNQPVLQIFSRKKDSWKERGSSP